MNTQEYLDYYLRFEPIEVVCHPHERISWGRNRKIYDGVFDLEYNHRSILNSEVVFDFDDSDCKKNETNSLIVCQRLLEDKLNFSYWSTGNKGYHIHTLWNNFDKISNPVSMKKIILKHYADGMKIDFQLAGKHLIRAEGGLNEKNLVKMRSKSLIYDNQGIRWNNFTEEIMNKYKQKLVEDSAKKILKSNESDVPNKKLGMLLNGEIKIQDNREKILFFAIHQLKKSHEFEEVCSTLCSWYRYSGGHKLSDSQIKSKVRYHWNREYSFNKDYLDEFLPKGD
jgi:hypothetical protein